MFKPLTDQYSVYGQLDDGLIRKAAEDGFQAIINNRPDNEEPGQPSSADLKAVADELGLAYHHVPIVPGQISEDDVSAMKAAFDSAPGKTLGFCRSGMRSTCLWALANPDAEDADSLINRAANAGYDISGMKPKLG